MSYSRKKSVKIVLYEYAFNDNNFPLSVKPQISALPQVLHQHENFYEIVLVTAGSGMHQVDNVTCQITQGDIFVLQPGACHAYFECKNLDYYNILIDFNSLKFPLFDLIRTAGYQALFVLAPDRARNNPEKYQCSKLDIPILEQCIKIIKRLYKFQLEHEAGFQFSMLACFYEFMQIICQAENYAAEKLPVDESNLFVKIGNIASSLEALCSEDWNIDMMCRKFFISRAVLFRLFQNYYQMSPMMFLNSKRIRKSMYLLLNSDIALEDVALECGFANSSYFITVFRKYTGMTPSQYRRYSNSIFYK